MNHAKRFIWQIGSCIALYLIIGGIATVGQGTQAIVSLPVKGNLLLDYDAEVDTLLVNTYDGRALSIIDGDFGRASLHFSPQGERVAYVILGRDSRNAIFNLGTGDQQYITVLDGREDR
ncbi:MAG: hypothetical protein H7Y11_05345, partial [Armatimonadetes bacterium]|nr:hypothetical protein [Anaerolineae bacterium]